MNNDDKKGLLKIVRQAAANLLHRIADIIDKP
jgi:hypothetical protein